MVKTRSQGKEKLVEMAAGSQAGSSHDGEETPMEFIERVLVKVENMEISFEEKLDELRMQNDEVKTQNEYTEFRCAQFEQRIKEVEEPRDQSLAKIENLEKTLEDTKNELVVVKKAVGHNSGGGVPRVKVKEPESYDGTRKAAILGNFLWDIEQYLERLNLVDGETQVKVATQFLTKDAKMWWRRRVDQIVNGSADDITSWKDLKKAL